jgi:hypothetical protein
MTPETHKKIRELMRKHGVWEYAVNTKIYDTQEFIEEIEGKMQRPILPELKELLIKNVKRMQYYLDDRILEPIEE